MKNILILIIFLASNLAVFSQSSISYKYDQQGRLIEEIYEENYSLIVSYDQEGNLIHKTSKSHLPGTNSIGKTSGTENSFAVYPNPVNNTLHIQALTDNTILSLGIFDASLKLIKTIHINESSFDIDMQGFRKGIYIIKINTSENSEIVKMIKQ